MVAAQCRLATQTEESKLGHLIRGLLRACPNLQHGRARDGLVHGLHGAHAAQHGRLRGRPLRRQRLAQQRLRGAAAGCAHGAAGEGRARLCMHARCTATPLGSAPFGSIREAATSCARHAGRAAAPHAHAALQAHCAGPVPRQVADVRPPTRPPASTLAESARQTAHHPSLAWLLSHARHCAAAASVPAL